MSLDLFLRSKSTPSHKEVEEVLFPLGWEKGEHLLFEPTGSYVWFRQENYESTRGAWIFVRKAAVDSPPGAKTLFHGYTNAGRTFEDLEALNSGIRALKRTFGGSLHDPQRGVAGYLVNDIPKLSPAEKACGFAYIRFQSNLARALFLKADVEDDAKKRVELLGSIFFFKRVF